MASFQALGCGHPSGLLCCLSPYPPFIDEQVKAQSGLGTDAWSHSGEVMDGLQLGPSRCHLPDTGVDGTASGVAADRELEGGDAQ